MGTHWVPRCGEQDGCYHPRGHRAWELSGSSRTPTPIPAHPGRTPLAQGRFCTSSTLPILGHQRPLCSSAPSCLSGSRRGRSRTLPALGSGGTREAEEGGERQRREEEGPGVEWPHSPAGPAAGSLAGGRSPGSPYGEARCWHRPTGILPAQLPPDPGCTPPGITATALCLSFPPCAKLQDALTKAQACCNVGKLRCPAPPRHPETGPESGPAPSRCPGGRCHPLSLQPPVLQAASPPPSLPAGAHPLSTISSTTRNSPSMLSSSQRFSTSFLWASGWETSLYPLWVTAWGPVQGAGTQTPAIPKQHWPHPTQGVRGWGGFTPAQVSPGVTAAPCLSFPTRGTWVQGWVAPGTHRKRWPRVSRRQASTADSISCGRSQCRGSQ